MAGSMAGSLGCKYKSVAFKLLATATRFCSVTFLGGFVTFDSFIWIKKKALRSVPAALSNSFPKQHGGLNQFNNITSYVTKLAWWLQGKSNLSFLQN